MCSRVGFFNDIGWTRTITKDYGKYDNKISTLTPHYNIAPSETLVALLNTQDILIHTLV